jgi:hypothetical protein
MVTDGIWCQGRDVTHLTAFLVDLINDLDSVQMIDTGIKTNLVHYDDTSRLCLRIQLLHSWGDVTGSDHMRLALDRGLDDIGVMGVGNEGDDDVICCDFLFKSSVIVDIQGNSGCPGQIASQFLGFCEGSAGCKPGGELRSLEKEKTVLTNCQVVPGITNDILGSRTSNEAAAQEKNLPLCRTFGGNSLKDGEYVLSLL